MLPIAAFASGVASIRSSSSKVRPTLASARLRSKHASSRGVVEHRPHLGIGHEQLAERALLLPRLHRVALHDPVGVVAARAGLDEREEHRLAEHEPERRVEIAQHALGVAPAGRRRAFVNCTIT